MLVILMKITKIILVITVISLLFSLFPANVVANDEYLIYNINPDNHSVSVISCSTEAEKVIIPAQINNMPVTSIATSAFQDCISLSSVVIPNSVTSIGTTSFSNCKSLKSLTIPNSVNYIGQSAFSCCTSLQSINLPNSISYIGDYVFSSCESLTSIVIPDCVTAIGNYSFNNCALLNKISLSENLISIGDCAFRDCSALSDIDIPNSVTSIGISAFRNCGIKTLKFPDSITSIGNNAFNSCNKLKEVSIGRGVTCLEVGVFRYCRYLKTVIVPKSITTISQFAFSGCSSLTMVKYEGTSSEWNEIIIKNDNMEIKFYPTKQYNYEYPINITYKANGGSNPPQKEFVAINSTYTISPVIPTRAGYKFIGWSTSKDDENSKFQPGDMMNLSTDNITFYALWKQISLNAKTSNDTLILTPDNLPSGTIIIFALYNQNTLTDMQVLNYEENADISYKPIIKFDNALIIAVDSLKNMIPLCNPERITVDQNNF